VAIILVFGFGGRFEAHYVEDFLGLVEPKAITE